MYRTTTLGKHVTLEQHTAHGVGRQKWPVEPRLQAAAAAVVAFVVVEERATS